ncbi:MAG: hypothetical protein ACYTGB_16475, partial [Planctomycetota bacterium]|jgi:hypothetical protein
VLANVDSLEVNRAAQVAEYVRAGGALLVFLGDQVDAAAYNATLFGGSDALTRIRLGEVARAPRGKEFRVAAGELPPPIMNFFEGGAGGLGSATFGRAFDLDLTTAQECVVHARLAPGERPLLVTADVGEGRMGLLNCSADVTWCNLPLKPAFTALVQRMVVWLLEPRSRCQNLLPGSKYRLVLPLAAVSRTITFRTPAGRTFTRQPTTIKGTRLALAEFAETEESGFYQVTWEGLEGEAERRLFAVNSDPAESDLTCLQEAGFRELAGGSRVAWLDAAAPAADRSEGGGREFWRAIVLLALAVLVLESYLSRRFSGGGL